jgi:hypothetical protein
MDHRNISKPHFPALLSQRSGYISEQNWRSFCSDHHLHEIGLGRQSVPFQQELGVAMRSKGSLDSAEDSAQRLAGQLGLSLVQPLRKPRTRLGSALNDGEVHHDWDQVLFGKVHAFAHEVQDARATPASQSHVGSFGHLVPREVCTVAKNLSIPLSQILQACGDQSSRGRPVGRPGLGVAFLPSQAIRIL